jgi:hypothetical protein
MTKRRRRTVTGAEVASMVFKPIPAEDLARMRAPLMPDCWPKLADSIQMTMALAIGVLEKHKLTLAGDLSGSEAAIAAAIELNEHFDKMTKWHQSAAQFLRSAHARLTIALAVVEVEEAASKAA